MINSAKKAVTDLVDGLNSRDEKTYKFCDSNLPSEIEPLDDVQEFDLNTTIVHVCIVVSIFDCEDCVSLLLHSILNQTHKGIETVFIDEGSSGGSKEILKISKDYDNVQAVQLDQRTSKGQSYNIGISKCSAKSAYVLINDGHITYERDAVSSMVSYAEHLRADVVLADFDVRATSRGRVLKQEYSHDMNQWSALPAGSPFNIYSEPGVLRVDPSPWRKLYRRRMLLDRLVQFKEGYYDGVDDSFHWEILAHATRISKLDRILFHRETMFETESTPRTDGKFFPNAHHVGKMLMGQHMNEDQGCLPSLSSHSIVEKYFEWVNSNSWLSRNQQSTQMKDKFDRRFKQIRSEWLARETLPITYWESLSEETALPLLETPSQVDLTIIMPTYNVNDLIQDVLDKMYTDLDRPGFSFEVFAIDDGSDDGTIKVLSDFQKKHETNFFLMNTPSSNGGAGRARNFAIPLIEGRYVYFVDADDGYDFQALAESVIFATKDEFDLLILPYETEIVGPNNTVTKGGMMTADEKIWSQLPSKINRTHEIQKEAAYGLINYPWKQLTASRVMHDSDVYFGPTKVHNDVQFHWTSIAAAKKIHFYHKKVCSHRKFDASVRGQLTADKSAARMNVFYAISLTQRALARQGVFDGDEREGYAFAKWLKFARDVLNWASKRIPNELESDYKKKWKYMLDTLKDEKLRPSTFRNWPFWEQGSDKN
eukprot:CAMPEP_0194203940 /NCGR_PEP_ID=MMETSP0156-20130528/3583_1 /TAXON_ID=33649 /ORGANISM="Thalassionema nitzschioides, Strain L26-B" /LENGTH=708 /DNA_ID=CAMNT_0038929803 /DNA_START=212 /DNA_END=2338 /DNA_ORIENTATION=-